MLRARVAFYGDFQPAGNPPSLLELRHFPVKGGHKDIVTEIKNEYVHFGTLLLEDESGNKVVGIEKARQRIPEDITVEILRRWLQGKGRLPITWNTLIQCLQNVNLHTTADDIKDVLSEEGRCIVQFLLVRSRHAISKFHSACSLYNLLSVLVCVCVRHVCIHMTMCYVH